MGSQTLRPHSISLAQVMEGLGTDTSDGWEVVIMVTFISFVDTTQRFNMY